MLNINKDGKELHQSQFHFNQIQKKEKYVSVSEALCLIDKNKRLLNDMNERRLQMDEQIMGELRKRSTTRNRLSEQQMTEFQNYWEFKEAVGEYLNRLYLQLKQDFRSLLNQSYRMTQQGKIQMFGQMISKYVQEQELMKTLLTMINAYSNHMLELLGSNNENDIKKLT